MFFIQTNLVERAETVLARMTVHGPDGELVRDLSLTVPVRASRPNGAGCDPEVWIAAVRVSASGLTEIVNFNPMNSGPTG